MDAGSVEHGGLPHRIEAKKESIVGSRGLPGPDDNAAPVSKRGSGDNERHLIAAAGGRRARWPA